MALPPFPYKANGLSDKIAIDWFEQLRTLVLAGGGGGGSGAPTTASYITLAVNGDLSAERVLTASTGIEFVDGGAGSTLTISAQEGIQRSWMGI